MWNSLLNAVGAAGNAIDLPGSSVRDALAGRNPLDQWATPLTDKNRTSGRDLLRVRGLAGSKDTWGNFAGGMLTEAALDPLNFIPGMSVAKAAKAKGVAQTANRGIDAANATSMAQRAAGFMPEETIKHLHPSVLESPGVPKKMYHGTVSDFDGYANSDSGTFLTPHGSYASSYANPRSVARRVMDGEVISNPRPRVNMHYVDARNPLTQELQEATPFGFYSNPELLQKNGYDSAIGHNSDEMVVFSPSQMYLPYIANAIQPRQAVPKITPAMMRLAMYNAAVRTAAQSGRTK